MLLSFAIKCGVGQFFKQGVSFAIENAIVLLDDGVPDGLGAVALTAPRWAKEQVYAPEQK